MKTRLIFVRHGDLEGEQKGILHTPDDQVSLSELGKTQMEEVSEILKKYNPSIIFSSAEKRTVDSAQIISKKLTIDTQQNPNLQGRRWGEFSGKTWDEVGKILSNKTLDDRYKFVPPGGESWQEFENRLLRSISTIANQHAGETIAIVSHGSTIRVLLPKVFNISREESLKLYPDYGTLSVADFENEKFQPVIFNSKV